MSNGNFQQRGGSSSAATATLLNKGGMMLFFLLSLSLVCIQKVDGSTLERGVELINNSGTTIEVYWVNPSNNKLHLMTTPDVKPGGKIPLYSYVGHEFEVHELPNSETGVCISPDETCRRSIFMVSENEDQLVKVNKDFEIDFTDSQIEAEQEAGDIIEYCKSKFDLLDNDDNEVHTTPEALTKATNSMIECVQDGMALALERVSEEINFQATIRKNMASKLENYTCADDALESSIPLREDLWVHPRDNLPRKVHIMHDRPASRIHVVENFIQQDECIAMEETAQQSLHHATVADGKGGSRLSENRKAMQAGIAVKWEQEQHGDPIARLSRRVYDYTNHVLGLNIEEHGQEDLMSIQYFGRGRNDTAPDRYTPHCDGDCTGLPHKHGTRMATMVMYCTIPTEGGHTNFPNAGIHVKPQTGNAVFFSYIDPQTRLMDNGFTEHSGCPVYGGEKKIVTQWIRYGVDAENPWDSFNTLGIKKSQLTDV